MGTPLGFPRRAGGSSREEGSCCYCNTNPGTTDEKRRVEHQEGETVHQSARTPKESICWHQGSGKMLKMWQCGGKCRCSSRSAPCVEDDTHLMALPASTRPTLHCARKLQRWKWQSMTPAKAKPQPQSIWFDKLVAWRKEALASLLLMLCEFCLAANLNFSWKWTLTCFNLLICWTICSSAFLYFLFLLLHFVIPTSTTTLCCELVIRRPRCFFLFVPFFFELEKRPHALQRVTNVSLRCWTWADEPCLVQTKTYGLCFVENVPPFFYFYFYFFSLNIIPFIQGT